MNQDEFKTVQTSLIDAGFKLVNENSNTEEEKNNITCVIIGVDLSNIPSTIREMIDNGNVIHAQTAKEAREILRAKGLLALLDGMPPKDPQELIDNIIKSAAEYNPEPLPNIDLKAYYAGGTQEYKRKKQSEKYRSRR